LGTFADVVAKEKLPLLYLLYVGDALGGGTNLESEFSRIRLAVEKRNFKGEGLGNAEAKSGSRASLAPFTKQNPRECIVMIQRTCGLMNSSGSWKWLLGLAVAQATYWLPGRRTSPVLRLATTTSVADSGLAAAILPDFERRNGCRVDVIAVGTGQALSIAGRGDADVVIVHARKQEEAFIAAGHAKQRHEIMFNDFVVIGPADDPAKAGAAESAADAFRAIAAARATFFSRGDKSGTHAKELAIWSAAGLAPGRKRHVGIGRWAREAARCCWPHTSKRRIR
jgi:hypothetical protein